MQLTLLPITSLRLLLPPTTELPPAITLTCHYIATSCNHSYLPLQSYLLQSLLTPTTELPPAITPTSHNRATACITPTSHYRATACNHTYIPLHSYFLQSLLPHTTELLLAITPNIIIIYSGLPVYIKRKEHIIYNISYTVTSLYTHFQASHKSRSSQVHRALTVHLFQYDTYNPLFTWTRVTVIILSVYFMSDHIVGSKH